jgi:hypothetical protein
MLSMGDQQQQEETENHPRDLISSTLRPSICFSFFFQSLSLSLFLETLPFDFFCSFIYLVLY